MSDLTCTKGGIMNTASEDWRYYNHALLPKCAPHEQPRMEAINDNSIWKLNKNAYLVRWTTDWDLESESNWWYIIKDSALDIHALKSKRRYEINKGLKNFEVRVINPDEYKHELYEVTVEAYTSWPVKYRPTVDEKSFINGIENSNLNNCVYFGAFDREDNKLCGYAMLEDYGNYIDFKVLRVRPDKEKLSINAAIVAGLLNEYEDRFDGLFYICDGARAVRHETAFQEYLMKYFGFRKCYCHLHIKYKWWFKMGLRLMYPIRNLISGNTSLGSKLHALLLMDSLAER